MADRYTTAQMEKVVKTALKVTQAAIDGKTEIYLGIGAARHEFDLLKGSRCQEFVRECFEAANGWRVKSWHYAYGNARQALQAMDRDGYRLPKGALIVPGDVLGHRRYTDGHIGIAVGYVDNVFCVAENTISGSRGNPRRPGTKLTPLNQFPYDEAHRFAAVKVAGVFVNGKNVYPYALLIGNKCYVPRRITAKALGATTEEYREEGSYVNSKPIEQIVRVGIGWVWARDLVRLCNATVAWQPGRVDLAPKTGGAQ